MLPNIFCWQSYNGRREIIMAVIALKQVYIPKRLETSLKASGEKRHEQGGNNSRSNQSTC